MELEMLRANLVRTVVPLIVGLLVSLIPGLPGQDQIATFIGFGVSAAYYTVFRIAETKYPRLGLFLGQKMPKAAHAPAGPADVAMLASAGPATPHGKVSVTIGGAVLPGVETFTWSAEGDSPTLTLRLRDPQVEFTTAGSESAPTKSQRTTAPPQRQATLG
ncbi:MAG: hypothetical protein JWR90_1121 [Marmoricola sp.]|jgi:hypothetical protein|nr:hypothetical protein [Marmoricola sp.]